jgi:hypothetical protein
MHTPPRSCSFPRALRRPREGVAFASAGLVLLLAGCPNPNTYTTPRTLHPGQVQWQLAPEVIGVDYSATYGSTDASGNLVKTKTSSVWPMLPTFGARIGVAEGLDIGLRAPNLEPLAADAKIRLLKGRLDVALDPGFQLYYGSANGSGFAVVYLHAPVLFGINLSEEVSLVLSPGLVYADTTASGAVPSGPTGSSTAEGLMARLGAGFDFRVDRKLAIHPEVTLVRQFTGSQDLLLCVGGIGFNFGAQPDYSDLARAPNSAAAPRRPASAGPPEEPAPPERPRPGTP